MEQSRFYEFTYNFLVNASQMAYVEEAHGTYKLLQSFNELFRYVVKDSKTVMLTDEFRVLKNYIDILKMRYGDRINISIPKEIELKNIFIKRLSVLDFIDNILNDALTRFERFTSTRIELERGESPCIKVSIEIDDKTEVFTKILSEEGI